MSSQDIQVYSNMYANLIKEKLRSVETMIEELANAIDACKMYIYSYQYNLRRPEESEANEAIRPRPLLASSHTISRRR